MDEAARARLHSTSGGFSETELKELAVRPTSSPSARRAVTMVTPVANIDRLLRNSAAEKLGARACGVASGTGMGGNLPELAHALAPAAGSASGSWLPRTSYAWCRPPPTPWARGWFQ